jgi:hypothetical protein
VLLIPVPSPRNCFGEAAHDLASKLQRSKLCLLTRWERLHDID